MAYSRQRIAPLTVLILAVSLVTAAPALADEVATHVSSSRSETLPVIAGADQAAEASAAAQAAAGKVFHADLSALLGICSSVGEVVGAGPNLPLVFASFKQSATHWSIITSPSWTAIGTGRAAGADGRLYVSVVFCQQAGGPNPAVSPPTSTNPAPVDPPPARGKVAELTTTKKAPEKEPVDIDTRRTEIRDELEREPECTINDRYAGLEREGKPETGSRAGVRR